MNITRRYPRTALRFIAAGELCRCMEYEPPRSTLRSSEVVEFIQYGITGSWDITGAERPKLRHTAERCDESENVITTKAQQPPSPAVLDSRLRGNDRKREGSRPHFPRYTALRCNDTAGALRHSQQVRLLYRAGQLFV